MLGDESASPLLSPRISRTSRGRGLSGGISRPVERCRPSENISKRFQDYLPQTTSDLRDDELSVNSGTKAHQEEAPDIVPEQGEPVDDEKRLSETKGKGRVDESISAEQYSWFRDLPDPFSEDLTKLRELIEKERGYKTKSQSSESREFDVQQNKSVTSETTSSGEQRSSTTIKMGDMNVGSFAGEDTDNVELFIDSVDFSFILLERNFPLERGEKAKLTYLYSFLTGTARNWWARLDEAKRDTWGHAVEALRKKYGRNRSLVIAGVNRERLNWEKAQAGINKLKQGEMYCEDYLRAADELHDIIGEGRHEVMLTARFMQGISDPVTRRMVHSMVDEPYTYESAREAFLRTTKEEREKEARQKMAEKETVKDSEGFAKSLLEV